VNQRAQPRSDAVLVELSNAQINQIVRSAEKRGRSPSALAALSDGCVLRASKSPAFNDSRLSSSLLAGLLILIAFPQDGSYVGNSQIASKLEMSTSTTHHYIATLVAAGLLERDPVTRKYRRAKRPLENDAGRQVCR
jgi:hypothetical protein